MPVDPAQSASIRVQVQKKLDALEANGQGLPADEEEIVPALTESQPDAGRADQSIGQEAGQTDEGQTTQPVVEAQPQAKTEAPPEEEWEDVTIQEAPGVEYTIRAKRGMGEKVRAGYLRRADYDRKNGKFGQYRNVLEPLIENGQFQAIAPLIQQAGSDPEYAQFVVEAYQRRKLGLPLTHAQQQVTQATDQSSRQANQNKIIDDLMSQIDNDTEIDPYTQSGLKKYVAPLASELSRLQRESLESQHRQRQQDEQQQQQQRAQQSRNQDLIKAHNLLKGQYPGEFHGSPADFPALNQIYSYAEQAGYIETFGVPGGMAHAKFVLDSMRNQHPTPASPLAGIKAQGEALRREAAKSVADKVIVGSPGREQPNPGKKKVALRDAKGNQRPMKDIVREALAGAAT